MSENIKIFFNGIANSLNPNGYNEIVTSTKELGSISKKINNKRKENYKRIRKEIDGQVESICRNY